MSADHQVTVRAIDGGSGHPGWLIYGWVTRQTWGGWVGGVEDEVCEAVGEIVLLFYLWRCCVAIVVLGPIHTACVACDECCVCVFMLLLLPALSFCIAFAFENGCQYTISLVSSIID